MRLFSFLNRQPAAPPWNRKPPPSHFPNPRAPCGDVRRTLNSIHMLSSHLHKGFGSLIVTARGEAPLFSFTVAWSPAFKPSEPSLDLILWLLLYIFWSVGMSLWGVYPTPHSSICSPSIEGDLRKVTPRLMDILEVGERESFLDVLPPLSWWSRWVYFIFLPGFWVLPASEDDKWEKRSQRALEPWAS